MLRPALCPGDLEGEVHPDSVYFDADARIHLTGPPVQPMEALGLLHVGAVLCITRCPGRSGTSSYSSKRQSGTMSTLA
jgi:hypothetical protein